MLVVYYHIFANPLGVSIAIDQLGKINRLLPDARIRCGVVEADAGAAAALAAHLDRVANAEVVARAGTGNEWLTLAELHADCAARLPPGQPVLYCHTKGAYSTPLQPAVISAWREWMEYFVLFRYADALAALGKGYTAYGFDAWLTPRRPVMRRLGFRPCFRFFSGNYWWTTAGAVRRIRLDGIDRSQRHSAEGDFLSRIPRLRPFDGLRLIGLPNIIPGAYTNYRDDFRHFPALMEKAGLLEAMRAKLREPAR